MNKTKYCNPFIKFCSKKVLSLLVTLYSLCIVSNSIAQDFDLDPYFGEFDLEAGFDDDPRVVSIAAGGSIDASGLGDNCVGFISEAPDVSINYDSGSYSLNFAAFSEDDITLIINDPLGGWICNDDFSESAALNPGIIFEDPANGKYDIWLGVYSSDEDDLIDASLLISEISLDEIFETYEEVSSGLVDDSLPSGSGTGFVVNRDGHILTNNHVVDGCADITFQIRGSEVERVALISTNIPSDLALLKASSFEGRPAIFAPSSVVQMGAELVVYGFPLTDDLSTQGNFTSGIVSAMSGLNDDLTLFQMTAPVQPGNSGGPVLSISGRIIGVVVATADQEFFRGQRGTDAQNVNFAIHSAISMRFLDTNNVNYETDASLTGSLSLADIANMSQEFTGIVRCRN
ncbi:MAG: hypothetical protein CMQ41_08220 [Gammaproteobacteria bacterium]|nr:hypothetical protein [Gammaproteobacteria bacterium]